MLQAKCYDTLSARIFGFTVLGASFYLTDYKFYKPNILRRIRLVLLGVGNADCDCHIDELVNNERTWFQVQAYF